MIGCLNLIVRRQREYVGALEEATDHDSSVQISLLCAQSSSLPSPGLSKSYNLFFGIEKI
jgi:hypothetical protein